MIENTHKNNIFVHIETAYCSHRFNFFLGGHSARYTLICVAGCETMTAFFYKDSM